MLPLLKFYFDSKLPYIQAHVSEVSFATKESLRSFAANIILGSQGDHEISVTPKLFFLCIGLVQCPQHFNRLSYSFCEEWTHISKPKEVIHREMSMRTVSTISTSRTSGKLSETSTISDVSVPQKPPGPVPPLPLDVSQQCIEGTALELKS